MSEMTDRNDAEDRDWVAGVVDYVRSAEPDGGDGLVATIIRGNYYLLGTRFLTDPEQPLQVAMMLRPAGDRVPAHVHRERKRVITQTQEVLVVRLGVALVTFYTSAGDVFDQTTLRAGDVCVLHGGGHAIDFLQDTLLLEVKTGPYSGKDQDKRML